MALPAGAGCNADPRVDGMDLGTFCFSADSRVDGTDFGGACLRAELRVEGMDDPVALALLLLGVTFLRAEA